MSGAYNREPCRTLDGHPEGTVVKGARDCQGIPFDAMLATGFWSKEPDMGSGEVAPISHSLCSAH